jgi:6-phosphogluconolactonase (cycloisomerase 2 family)
VSIGVFGQLLYVVNKAADGSEAPNYTALMVDDAGRLTPVANTTLQTPLGGSPSTAYVVSHRRLLFGTQFFDSARADDAPRGQLDAFTLGAQGSLSPAPGTPLALPPDPEGTAAPAVAQNLVAHPWLELLYVGFPTRRQLGVYRFDDQGTPSFLRAVPSSGEGTGWFLLDAAAEHLYAVNALSSSISTFALADPRIPEELGTITLASAPSQPTQLAFDTDQRRMLVLGQGTDTSGNFLHLLSVGEGGKLEPTGAPLDLAEAGVATTARPLGILVLSRTVR